LAGVVVSTIMKLNGGLLLKRVFVLKEKKHLFEIQRAK